LKIPDLSLPPCIYCRKWVRKTARGSLEKKENLNITQNMEGKGGPTRDVEGNRGGDEREYRRGGRIWTM
jgi:hypothetical protein